MSRPAPLTVINSAAPIRICDNGGWTDTWFARHGRIFNIGVYPIVEVQLEVFRREDVPERCVIHAENYGERYSVDPEASEWDRHPLLEAAIRRMGLPDELAFQATIYSEAPAGASTGTSAAVSVALVGALDYLTPGCLSDYEIAVTAHSIETEMLGLQCGIQDQLCSAFGGINYIEMTEYPRATVSPVKAPDETWWELERRLALIYLGRGHHSSAVHEQVIAELSGEGPECKRLEDLRRTAGLSRDALYAGDFNAFGRAMIENNDAQERLNPSLIGEDARRVIEAARAHGAAGWKVNGAGGEGGSVTLLAGPLSCDKRAMLRDIESIDPLFRNIPLYLSRRGLRRWRQSGR